MYRLRKLHTIKSYLPLLVNFFGALCFYRKGFVYCACEVAIAIFAVVGLDSDVMILLFLRRLVYFFTATGNAHRVTAFLLGVSKIRALER
jgi:hypothetical protein